MTDPEESRRRNLTLNQNVEALQEALDAAERDLEQAQTYAEELENDVFALRIALADAIRRPMGVVPASAEGLISLIDLDAAEERRVKGKTT